MTEHDVVPRLRQDIDTMIIGESGEELVVLRDSYGYAEEPIAIPMAVMPILEMLDGASTLEELAKKIMLSTGVPIAEASLKKFLAQLDIAGFLESPLFFERKRQHDLEFHDNPIRPAACAGSSYPADPKELERFLTNVMATASMKDVEPGASAALIPHIDLRVGAECYAPAYKALQDCDADVFVVIGTSHYGWQDLFILTEKNFETPLGIAETDTEMVKKLREKLPFKLTNNDIAHRQEHSLEFQIIFLQHLFRHKKITILPVLVTSFQKYLTFGMPPGSDEKVREFATALRAVIAESGKKAVYIASGDMAHVGKKFGDDFSAEYMLNVIRLEDEAVIKTLEKASTEELFGEIARAQDKNRICGFPPVYTLLEAVQPKRGKLLQYEQWNEKETESAVTFASVAFYDK